MSSQAQENVFFLFCFVFLAFSWKQLVHVGRIRPCLLFRDVLFACLYLHKVTWTLFLRHGKKLGHAPRPFAKWFFPKNPQKDSGTIQGRKMLMFPHLSQASFLQHSRGLARDIFGSSLKLRGFRKCTWGDVACALLVLSLIFLSEARTYPESA